MKKPKVSFRPYGGSGPLSIHWYDAFGDAEEAVRGEGVCWYSPRGEILAVEFDDVDFSSDDQTLELKDGSIVHIKVKEGRVHTDLRQPSVDTAKERRAR
ncbi:MAG: hypothetical protein C5B49_03495 [Bdellovibrio sp.]|nr:MAG: hypothetical protein C5B49_03495 [Bdellovibrio sp.]